MRWSTAAAILLLAASLRLAHLADPGFNTSELSAVRLANTSQDRFLAELRAQSGATPAPYAVLRAATLYGLRERPLRLPAALAGILGVGAAMLLVRELFGARAALVSGLLVATSPLHVEVSRQAGAAGISMAASLLLAWLLVRLLRGERILWRTAFAGAVALYCGYGALAVLGAATVTALCLAWWPSWRAAALRLLAASAIALALFAPWGIYDLPTEPGAQFVAQLPDVDLWRRLVTAPFTGAAGAGDAATAAAVAAGLAAAIGAVIAWRRRRPAAIFALALLLIGVGGVVAMARVGHSVLAPAQFLFVLPVFFGLGAVALEGAARALPWPGMWTPACLAGAALLAWTVEKPALAALPDDAEDWRGAFALLERNLGRDDLVAAPMANDATQVYGLELSRRLPGRDRVSLTYPWLARQEQGWLVAGLASRLNPESPKMFSQLSDLRFLVDLSPSPEPALFYMGAERRSTYITACHFDLPARVLARQTIIRDCLRELGTMEGPLRQVRVLLTDPRVSLRNPSLLESATLLAGLGKVDEGRALVAAVAAREPDWPEARAALAELALKPTPATP